MRPLRDHEAHPLSPPPGAPVHVFISAGHRNRTGGGAPGEAALTRPYAEAYAEAFAGHGFSVHFMQRTAKSRDGCFNGTIRQVAYAILRQARVLPGDRLVMLDLHMDALHSDPGVFTIVPDDPTVPTGTRDPAADVWENNPRAVALGHAIARSISRWTGLEQRQCRELGVMSERETRVGSSGRRLSMFRVTAPLRDRLIRLLIEHGSLGRDAAILHDPATPRACAEAAAAAVESFFHPRPAP